MGLKTLLLVVSLLFLVSGASAAITALDSAGQWSVDVNSPTEDSLPCGTVDTNFNVAIIRILNSTSQTVDRNIHMTFNGFDINRQTNQRTWFTDYNAASDSNSVAPIYYADGNVQINAGATSIILAVDLNNDNVGTNVSGDFHDLNVYGVKSGAGGPRDGNWSHFAIYVRPAVTKANYTITGGADNNSFCSIRPYSSVSNVRVTRANTSNRITFLDSVDLSGATNYDTGIPTFVGGSSPKLQVSGVSAFAGVRSTIEFEKISMSNPEVFRAGNACSPLCNVPTVSPSKILSFTTQRTGDAVIYEIRESAPPSGAPSVSVSPIQPYQASPVSYSVETSFWNSFFGGIVSFFSGLFGFFGG